MAGKLNFHRDQYNGPDFTTDDPRLVDLGTWLVSDVQNYAPDCLDLLACVEDVRSGRSPGEQWEGNAYEADFDRDGVVVESLYDGDSATSYPLVEAHAAMLRYLDFLAPTAADKARALDIWEKENDRRHPGREQLLMSRESPDST